MKRRSRAFFVVALVFVGVVALSLSALACSRVLWNDNGVAIVVGRSMDWAINDDPEMWVYPRGMEVDNEAGPKSLKWKSKYGSVVLTAWGLAETDGINEKGLGVNLLYLHTGKYEKRDKRPGVALNRWVRYFLDSYATVEEAAKDIRNWQLVPVKIKGKILPLHIAMEDASGDSMIIEYVNEKLVVHHGKEYAVMTNEPEYDWHLANLKNFKVFGGKEHLPGDISSKDRFVRGVYYLKHLPKPKDASQAVGFMMGLMGNIAVPYGAPYEAPGESGTYPTWWLTVMDLTNRVYYFSSTLAPNVIWVSLSELNFKEGQPVMKLDPRNPALVGDVSGAFKPVTK